MQLKLKQITPRREQGIWNIAIEVIYGSEGDMCTDTVQVNCNTRLRKVYITVEAVNRGIGFVVERFVETVTSRVALTGWQGNIPLSIVEHLAEEFAMEYDHELVKEAFREYW